MLKLSDEELKLSKSELYFSFIKRRSRLSWSLISFLISLVVTFNLVTVFMPDLANKPVIEGTMITLGISSAFVIIVSIVVAAVYYVRWNNIELDRVLATIREQVAG